MSVLSKIKTTIVLSLGIFLFSRWLPAVSQGQKLQWKGKIEVENGVKVVKNPAQPLYGEFACQPEQNLSVGGNVNDDNYYLPGGASIAVDQQGNLFIRDAGNIMMGMDV